MKKNNYKTKYKKITKNEFIRRFKKVSVKF